MDQMLFHLGIAKNKISKLSKVFDNEIITYSNNIDYNMSLLGKPSYYKMADDILKKIKEKQANSIKDIAKTKNDK